VNLRVFVSLGIHLIPPCLILFSFLFSQNDYIADLAPVVVWTPPAESDNATNESSTAAAAASTTTTAAASTAGTTSKPSSSMMAGQVPEDLRVGSVPAENAGVGATVEGGAKQSQNKVPSTTFSISDEWMNEKRTLLDVWFLFYDFLYPCHSAPPRPSLFSSSVSPFAPFSLHLSLSPSFTLYFLTFLHAFCSSVRFSLFSPLIDEAGVSKRPAVGRAALFDAPEPRQVGAVHRSGGASGQPVGHQVGTAPRVAGTGEFGAEGGGGKGKGLWYIQAWKRPVIKEANVLILHGSFILIQLILQLFCTFDCVSTFLLLLLSLLLSVGASCCTSRPK